MARRAGTVWFGDRLVGRIREDEGRNILFAYDSGWLDGTGFPVSISLPLSIHDKEVDAHAWFTGLLPEGDALLLACRMSGVRQSDPMGLLLACGADCAGALSILRSEEYMPATAETRRELPVGELTRLVNSSGKDMPAFPGGGVRFSLAGAQRKLAVVYDGGAYFLSTRASPSSHILKFETAPGVCFAESITHAIAGETGLPVVETHFLQTGDDQSPWLRISRYDRVRDQDGALVRVHQEDMAQALRLHSFEKYQTDQYDDGPSIRAIARLLQAHAAQPAVALSTLLDWQILNCLLGNWDGHAKNLSLLYPPGQHAPALAPAYDMVSIEYLNRFQPESDYYAREMGLAVGGNVKPERVTRADWEQMAADLGLPVKTALARLEEKATILPGLSARVLEEFIVRHGGNDDYEQMFNLVGAHCRQALDSIFRRGVTRTDKDPVTETKPYAESRKSSP